MRYFAFALVGVALAAAPLSAQQCYGCIFYTDSYEHRVIYNYNEGEPVTSPGGTHGQIPGQCSETWGHETCAVFALVPDILELFDHPEATVAADVLAFVEAEELVRFNADRRAIQVLGCDQESVIVHIPVDHLLARDLSRAVSEDR